ncbi:type I secretion system permease/ATPase [Meridianimarinicoccus roseus]|uniref:type I secretion system permease/ATPase n=1 Tax=Meridianimarinicoccus roseus TaxID=2072018 RepID=UPI001EE64CED|nr:ATP-binding cassette domain-containing protein [Meridianimarinicoccus roseus]
MPTLRTAIARMGSPLLAVFLFSFAVNLLMLSGPLFMLQVYDRVLGSGSRETLVTLFVLICFLFGCMWALDAVRGVTMVRLSARLRAMLEQRVLAAGRAAGRTDPSWGPTVALADLDAVRKLMSSPVALALFDMPWTPLYFALLFVFHPSMGWLGIAGGAVIAVLALTKRMVTRTPSWQGSVAEGRAARRVQAATEMGDTQRMLGVQDGHEQGLLAIRDTALHAHAITDERIATFGSATRIFRLFLQSAMLALGAHLVLAGELTSGAMIAGSILLGRGLAPLEVIVGNLTTVQASLASAHRIDRNLAKHAVLSRQTAPSDLPERMGKLEVRNVSFATRDRNRPIVSGLSFDLNPGEAMAVIGPSGSGKSVLARMVIGGIEPSLGAVRLGGFAPHALPADMLARWVGFVPQSQVFFDGTIAENVARLSPEADNAAVVAALEYVHALSDVTDLPQGLLTDMRWAERVLSQGTLQRICLARALIAEPELLVLDDPVSGLGQEGTALVNKIISAYKAQGKAVIVITQRPSVLRACDNILAIDDGKPSCVGPRDEVLARLMPRQAPRQPERPTEIRRKA